MKLSDLVDFSQLSESNQRLIGCFLGAAISGGFLLFMPTLFRLLGIQI